MHIILKNASAIFLNFLARQKKFKPMPSDAVDPELPENDFCEFF